MSYEVELKFPLIEPARVLSDIAALGAERQPALIQIDRYFAHPSRDFAQTNEALRIRTIDEAGRPPRQRVTYKGPVVDTQTKTRREIEIPFGEQPADGERFAEILTRLGFREVRSVRKRRTPYQLFWEERRLELAHDEVDGLGVYFEIEAVADEDGRDAARDAILCLAARLGLEGHERRSYLKMLLEADATS